MYKDVGLKVFLLVPVIFGGLIFYIALKFYEKRKGEINDYLSY